MNTSNGFNSIQMFTTFLPADFQIISPGQLKTKLRPFLSPIPEAVAVLGPCGDTPNTAEQGPAVQRGLLGCRVRCWGAEQAVGVQAECTEAADRGGDRAEGSWV